MALAPTIKRLEPAELMRIANHLNDIAVRLKGDHGLGQAWYDLTGCIGELVDVAHMRQTIDKGLPRGDR